MALYFQAYTAATGNELYRLRPDGVTVALVGEVIAGGASGLPRPWFSAGNGTPFATLADTSLFGAQQSELYFEVNDGVHGAELWKVKADGTVALASDIRPGATGSVPNNLTQFNGELYFAANDGGPTGVNLWKVASNGAVVKLADRSEERRVGKEC